MQEQKTLRQQIEAFEKEGPLGIDQFGGFFDWFCKKSSLLKKSKSLMSKVKTFIKKFDIDIDKTYVIFKNNCPACGRLYDDFRICDLESDDVIWTVIPKGGHDITPEHEKAEIWGRENNFDGPIYKGQNLTEIYRQREVQKPMRKAQVPA